MILKEALRPAIFYCNALGDHLLTRPTVLALQRIFGGKLSCIGAGRMPDLFFPDARFKAIKRLFFTETSEFDHGFSVDAALRACQEFDLIISLNPWHSLQTEELRQRLRPIPFFGLAPELGFISVREPSEHMVDYTFQVALALDQSIRLEEFVSLHPIAPIDFHRARQLKDILPKDKKVLAVHTITKAFKCWPIDHFRDLIEGFLLANPDYIAVIVDPIDLDLDAHSCSDRTFCLDGIDMGTATHIVATCDAFVGIDSFFLHVADIALRPSIGIFIATSPEQWGFRFSPHARAIAVSSPDNGRADHVLNELSAVLDAAHPKDLSAAANA